MQSQPGNEDRSEEQENPKAKGRAQAKLSLRDKKEGGGTKIWSVWSPRPCIHGSPQDLQDPAPETTDGVHYSKDVSQGWLSDKEESEGKGQKGVLRRQLNQHAAEPGVAGGDDDIKPGSKVQEAE